MVMKPAIRLTLQVYNIFRLYSFQLFIKYLWLNGPRLILCLYCDPSLNDIFTFYFAHLLN